MAEAAALRIPQLLPELFAFRYRTARSKHQRVRLHILEASMSVLGDNHVISRRHRGRYARWRSGDGRDRTRQRRCHRRRPLRHQQERERRRTSASTISGNRLVRSLPEQHATIQREQLEPREISAQLGYPRIRGIHGQRLRHLAFRQINAVLPQTILSALSLPTFLQGGT
jgi:hypothetical protein